MSDDDYVEVKNPNEADKVIFNRDEDEQYRVTHSHPRPIPTRIIKYDKCRHGKCQLPRLEGKGYCAKHRLTNNK